MRQEKMKFMEYIKAKLENWKRFFDDCLSIWPFSVQDLKCIPKCIEKLTQRHPIQIDQIYIITYSRCAGFEIWNIYLYLYFS